MYIDFAEVKRRVSIQDATQMLGLMLKHEKNQLRGLCPSCNAGGERALVITPDRNLFYCFSAKKGGDQIALVQHITGVELQEAAAFLLPQEEAPTVPQAPQGTSKPSEPTAAAPSKAAVPFDADAYIAKLDFAHEQVKALGLTPEEAMELGVGYSTTGFHRNTLVFAIRWPSGEIAAFASATDLKFPKKLLPMKVVQLRRA